MTIMNPISANLFGRFDDLVHETLRGFHTYQERWNTPSYFYESETSYQLRLDLPGFNKDEITVKLEDHLLSVRAISELEGPFSSPVEKRFTLPSDIEANGISATYEDGVLALTLNKKSQDEIHPLSIEIQ